MRETRLTRRVLLQSVAAASGAAAVVGRARAARGEGEEGVRESLGPGRVRYALRVNGRERAVSADTGATLLNVLRDPLALTGPKDVCDAGACGACTVHLDGKPVVSCMMLALDARGREVTTIEGLGTPEKMDPVQAAFVEKDALMCGFCTPGMVMSVRALLDRNANPTLDEVKRSCAGNLCRCGAYPHIFDAALAAARTKPTA